MNRLVLPSSIKVISQSPGRLQAKFPLGSLRISPAKHGVVDPIQPLRNRLDQGNQSPFQFGENADQLGLLHARLVLIQQRVVSTFFKSKALSKVAVQIQDFL